MASVLAFVGLFLMFLASERTIRGSGSTDITDWGEKEEVWRWNVEEFPNPQERPKFCNRFVPSNVCDPDGILKKEQADRLDSVVRRLYNDTPCVCPKCRSPFGGMVIGIAVMEHIFLPYNEHRSDVIQNFAEELRKRWSLGQCKNDIVIVLVTRDRLSSTSVGPGISSYISSQETRIFLENSGHFTNGNHYEGLMAMIEAYYNLSRSIEFEQEIEEISPGLIAGIVVGVIMLIVLIIVAGCTLRKRMSRPPPSRKDSRDGDPSLSWKRTQYELCSTQEMGEKPAVKKRGDTENNNDRNIRTNVSKQRTPKNGDETLATNETVLPLVVEVENEGTTSIKGEIVGERDHGIPISNTNGKKEPELEHAEREDGGSAAHRIPYKGTVTNL